MLEEKIEKELKPDISPTDKLRNEILASLPDVTGQKSESDPVISEDDRKLINKASRTLEGLKIEMKTVIGFTSDYLVEKYGLKTQEQFDRVVGPL